MDPTLPAGQSRVRDYLGRALEYASKATTTKRRRAKNKVFGIWTDFCHREGKPGTLDGMQPEEKLNYLLAFAMLYRLHGQKGKQVRAKTVSNALTAVGKGFTDLGRQDPRIDPRTNKLYPVLDDLFTGLRNEDPPESRSYPVNITIIRELWDALDLDHKRLGYLQTHTIDLIVVAFFWLLRPAEYLLTPDAEGRSQAFRLCDVQFTIKNRIHSALDAPLHDENGPIDQDAFARSITYASLTFSDQKNAVKGEQIGQSATNDPDLCPAKALGRIVHHLRTHDAPPTTPLYMFYNTHPKERKWYSIKSGFVTTALRHAAERTKQITGVDPDLISARSLRPGGATALLCANVDSDSIMLLGRWKSDAMLRYLRIQAKSSRFAQRMLDHGAYTFHPQAFLNQQPPNEAPAAVHDLLQHLDLCDADADEV